jgi:hypothetical protein
MGASREQKVFVSSELAKLEVFYGIKLSEYAREVYVEEFCRLAPERLVAAVERVRNTWTPTAANPFPPIYVFLEGAGKVSEKDEAALAIMVLKKATSSTGAYNSVSFCDPALHQVIINNGGWLYFCREINWDIWEGRIRDDYRVAKLAGQDGGTHLRGEAEAQGGRFKVDVYSVSKGKKIGDLPYRMGGLLEDDVKLLEKLCYRDKQPGESVKVLENNKNALDMLTAGMGKSVNEAIGWKGKKK